MIYCQGYCVTFQEVPDEVSLVLLIGDCPYRCKNCHSPILWEKRGDDVSKVFLTAYEKYKYAISCVCFMGVGQDDKELAKCANFIRMKGLNVAAFTGEDLTPLLKRNPPWLKHITWLKTGPYIEELGGLSNPETNQRMYRCTPGEHWQIEEDVTVWFQRKIPTL